MSPCTHIAACPRKSCAASLREDAIVRFGLLAGMTTATTQGPKFRAGLCVIQKQDNGRDVQLKARCSALLLRGQIDATGALLGSAKVT